MSTERQRNGNRKRQPVAKFILSGFMLLTLALGLIAPGVLYPTPAAAAGMPVIDVAHIGETILEGLAAAGRFAIEQAADLEWRLEESAAAIAYKSSLHMLLNNFAYDTATWLAAGGKGQTPYFHTDSWGEYLSKAVDGAAGNFISELGDDWLGFNVCNPDLPFRINLVEGFQDNFRRTRPDCTASELARDWEKFVQSENFLNHFVKRFHSDQNEILVGLTLYDKYYQALSFEYFTKQQDREEDKGLKPVTSLISGKILTPSGLVDEEARQLIRQGNFEAEKVHTGDIIADAISTFVETLAGKLFQRLFKEGLASLRGDDDSSRSFINRDLYTGESGRDLFTGQQAAAARYVTIVDAGIITGGPYEILQQLTTCRDLSNPGPEECVIDQNFRLAIEKEMTVREAIDAGYLDGNAPFGFSSPGFEPSYAGDNKGYPYRSLLILRAHRIIPVTWEVAAKIIDKGFVGSDRVVTLNTLIAEYDNETSPFHHLVDQYWVLKAPEAFCKAEGYGPVIINDRVSNDGQRIVTRSQYCADYQSCIEKDNEGKCIYGYCTEEQPTWNLQAESCLPEYSTCQTFVNGDGDAVSYLQNTLNYNSCSVDNAGCQWYCRSYNATDGIWACVNDAERVLKPCTTPAGCPLTAGCSIPEGGSFCVDAVTGANLTISSTCSPNTQWWVADLFSAGVGGCRVNASCTVEHQGVQCIQTGCENRVNQLRNNSFETAAPAGTLAVGWSGDPTYFERVSGGFARIHSGRNSVRFYNVGGVAGGTKDGVMMQSDELVLPRDGTYTLSGYVFDRLNIGSISFKARTIRAGVSTDTTPVTLTQTAKNRWYQVSFDSPALTAGDRIQLVATVSGEQVSGTAWFDDFSLTESCLISPVTLTLAGTITEDESKIHFDRDAEQCNAQGDGCSQFYASPTKRISNLLFDVTDPSFELYQDSAGQPGDQDFKNWTANNTGGARTIVTASTDSHSGGVAMQFQDGGGGETYATLTVDTGKPLNNRTFIVSYYAKLGSGSNFSCAVESGFGVGTTALGCQAGDRANVVSAQGTPINGISSKGLDAQWKRFSAVIAVPNDPAFSAKQQLEITLRAIPAGSGSILYDDIQLEEVTGITRTEPTPFQGYTTLDEVHLRKAPDYLGCQGFTLERPSDYVLKDVTEASCIGNTLVWRSDSCVGGSCCHQVDPPECFGYAPYCQPDEIGCQSFAPLTGGPAIPGVAASDDYCGVECVGYDAFKQAPTYFESTQSIEFFIPKTAQQCSVAVAGCDEFTNLDEVAAGGEGREYYQYLRQCIKPDVASCSNFYSWQGSDDSGYQLSIYNLKTDGADPDQVIKYDPARPNDVAYPDAWCDNKSDGDGDGSPDCCDGSEDLAANPFCREFFDRSGDVHYVLYDNTISCAETCHPYRKTRLGELDTDAQVNCVQSNGTWENNACVYYAIPDQGIACPAQAAGCREYRGNAGGNVFTAFSDNFEDGDTRGWAYGSISSDALSVGGHSIRTANQMAATAGAMLTNVSCSSALPHCSDANSVDCYNLALDRCVAANTTSGDTCLVAVGDQTCSLISEQIHPGRSYILSFWAKASGSGSVGLNVEYLTLTATGFSTEPITSFTVGSQWGYYTFGPFDYANLDTSRALAFLVAASNRDIFLDNIIIKEVVDHVYVIKDSWQTPASCDTNPFVNPAVAAPQFMLGCRQYRDANNQIHNLKSFSSLCREDAVGCEAMIDTFNSDDQFSQEFNTADAAGSVTVPPDRVVTMVNRAEFRCDATQEGCTRLGRPSLDQSGAVAGYSDAYVINDPDQYQTTLCGSGEVGCSEFQTNQGFFYFKEPGLQTCEYRQIPSQPSGFGWFKIGSTSLTPDCPIIRSSLDVVHPAIGWTGLCPAEASSCTEFIDPVSRNAKNLVFNADFQQDLDTNGTPDGWSVSGTSLTQKINLTRGTLYTVAIRSRVNALNSADLKIEVANCPGITSFDHSMASSGADALQIPSSDFKGDWDRRPDLPAGRQYSARFFVPAAGGGSCTVRVESAADVRNLVSEVAIRESSTHYVLGSDVDKTSCNGIVNQINGCVLFNDRNEVNFSISENDSSYLRFDADLSGPGVNSSVPVSNCGGVCDSSTVLKVRPDRACGQWLDCQTKVKSVDAAGNEVTYCVELAACSDLNESGECTNFILPDRQAFNDQNANATVAFTNHDKIAYLSGYAKAGSTLAGATGAQGVIPGLPFEPGNTFNGFYPFNLMSQFGEVAKVSNGNFEDYPELEYPVGWAWANGDGRRWGAHLFRVISSVVEAQDNEGITLQGRASLKVNADNIVISDPISVLPNTDYTLSASINTLNLQPTDAEAVVEVVDTSLNTLAELKLKARLDWTNLSVIINRAAIAGTEVRVQVRNDHPNTALLAEASYFDNIQMLPTLEVQALPPYGTDQKSYISRSCRVYPQPDSLACRYRDSAGAIQQGWSGYCLEPDPQRSGVCLQWWPVDLIKGDAFGTYIGYNNRLPLYYCMEAKSATTSIEFVKQGDLILDGSKPSSMQPVEGAGSLDSDKCITFAKIGGDWLNFPDGTSINLPGGVSQCDRWAVGVCKYEGTKTAGIDILHENMIESIEILNLKNGPPKGLGRCFGQPKSQALSLTKTSPGVPSGIVTTGNPQWIAAQNTGGRGGGHCTLGVKAVFDDNGLLDQMWFWYADSSMRCDPAPASHLWEVDADVQLQRNYCTQLVQTVTPVGENRAWVSRTAEGSSYDQLECTINGRDSIVLLDNVCALRVSCEQVGGTGEFRCGGLSSGERCSVCEYSTDYAPFGAAVPEDPYNITNSDKLYWQLPDTENFEPPYQARMGQVPYRNGTPTNSYLKRLFAQSFSFWKWQEPGDLVCVGGSNDGKICTNTNQQCPDGSCVNQGNVCGGNTTLPGESCEVATCGTDGAGTAGTCNFVSEEVGYTCTGGASPGKSCCPIPIGGGADTPTCEPMYTCSESSLNPGRECNPDSSLPSNFCSDGTCAPQHQGFQPDLANPLKWGPPEKLCELGTANVRVFLCSRQSDNSGTVCDPTIANACPNGRCDAIDLGGNKDYCAVAPRVRNILINGQNGTAEPLKIINQRGSGSVTLLFNAVMDGNQLPLTAYQVDWGDGSKVAVSGTNLRDRSNTTAPYKLTHSYSYYEILSQNKGGDRIYCSATGETPPGFSAAGLPANWCAVKPRIQIQDNWGWCNGSVDPNSGSRLSPEWGYRVGSITPNPSCSSNGAGGENVNAWTSFGGASASGYVIVGIND